MRQAAIRFLLWLAGIAGIVAIVWLFRPEQFTETLISTGVSGLGIWLVLTMVARLLLAETVVLPLRVLGFGMSRAEAFWIGWIRTLANQVIPFSGAAAFAKIARSRLSISWSELAALAAPQIVLAIAALGLVGLAATACNTGLLQSYTFLLAFFFLFVMVLAIALVNGAPWVLRLLPRPLDERALIAANALRRLARHPNLIVAIILFHAGAIVLRGGRLWVFFVAAGVPLSWQELLLVIALAESTMLVNITPGALGIREAVVISGSALLGIPASVAAGVALADRLFVVAATALFAVLGMVQLRQSRTSDA